MDISPLIDAGAIVVFHTATALLSLVLGVYILARPKGTQVHFWMGRTWITAMLGVVISSFMIFDIRLLSALQPHPFAQLVHPLGVMGWMARGKTT